MISVIRPSAFFSFLIATTTLLVLEFFVQAFQIAENGNNPGVMLANDHPIGVTYPTVNPKPNPKFPDLSPQEIQAEYRMPTGTGSDSLGRANYFFDADLDGRLDKNEIRLYNSGEGAEIECATCHDPHGIASNGEGSRFVPSFLRVTNRGSKLCLTCHNMIPEADLDQL